MPIQFACPSCHEPIEVDDHWATRQVACPYCKNTVTAPEVSTYEPPPTLPEARMLDPAAIGGGSPPLAAPRKNNAVAIWAFGLSCLWIAALVGFYVVLIPSILKAVGPDATPEELQRYFTDELSAGPPPAWMGVACLSFLLALLFWVAGLVCAILGVRLPQRRGFAIAAFALLSLGPILLCSGLFLGRGSG